MTTDPQSHFALIPLNTDGSLVLSPLWRKMLRWAVGWILGLMVTSLTLTLLVWVGLHGFILPHIDFWREEIQALTSRVVGVPVRLGSIRVQSKGWSPTIELSDVVLMDAQSRPALVLPKVLARLSPRSVLALEPRFKQVVIDGAVLEIERDAKGHLHVAGLPLTLGLTEHKSTGLDWLFRQSEIAIRGGTVRWTNLQRPAAPLVLSDVQLVLRNGVRQHAMQLDASPPPHWGQRLSLRGRFQQSLLADSGDWSRWSGTLFSELTQLDLGQIKHYAQLPFALDQGQGAVRAWVDVVDGQAVGATLDLALQRVAVQFGPQAAPLTLQRLEGRVIGTRRGNNTRINLSQFGFVTQAGLEWSRSDVSLAWEQSRRGEVSGGEVSAQRLDLNLLTQIANHLPLSESLRQGLHQAQAQGVVQGLGITWEGPMGAPIRYKLKGGVSNLALEAVPAQSAVTQTPTAGMASPALGRPCIRGATLDIAATEKGGRAQVQVSRGALTWPGLWEDPAVPLKKLNAQLQWRIEPAKGLESPKLTVELTKAEVDNDDMQGEARATWTRLPALADQANPGILDLTAQLHRGRADQVARYLPLSLGGRTYLAAALSGGRLSEGHVRVRGDLKNFPFRSLASNHLGHPWGDEMRITARVEDLNFAFVPNEPAHGDQPERASPWPALSSVAGEFILERDGIQFRDVRAHYQGVGLSKIQAHIKHLGPAGVLVLEGQGEGPLHDLLQFVNASPLGRWAAQAQSRAQSHGMAGLKLSLNLPLSDTKSSTVKGSVTLPGNQIRWSPELPTVTGLQGRIDFTQNSLTLAALKGKLLGGDVHIQGGWQVDAGLKVLAEGRISADGLRQATEWPELARWSQALRGETNYQLTLGTAYGHPEILFTSNGQGLSIDLPAPLTKSAQTTWNVQLQTQATPPEPGTERVVADTVHLTLGPQFQAHYARDLRGPSPQVVAGQILMGVGAMSSWPKGGSQIPPRAGVSALINVPLLDLDAWRALGDTPVIALTAPLVTPVESAPSYTPSSILLQANELTIASRKLSNAKVNLQSEGSLWRARVDADQLHGLLTYQPASEHQSAKIMVRLSRLNLPPTDAVLMAKRKVTASSRPPHTASAPSLDIVIEDFAWRDKKLGRLELEALSAISAVGRSDSSLDWRLSRLLLITPEATLTASGQWGALADHHRQSQARQVVVDFKLELSDSGDFIERLGLGRAIRGGKGLMAGQLAWLGSPMDLELDLLSGQMNIAIERGQFLKAEPGAARLLGVLSLQSLPRRLALDFRDVFQQGFAFDGITGDVKLGQGVASTNNLRMRGVQAVVLMEGHADLQNETQDLRVVVVPELNAGTASLAYAVINPALGLGTFLAQLFLRKPLTQASTREFRIQGAWDDPQVTKVDGPSGPSLTGAGSTIDPVAPALDTTQR